MPAIDGLRAIAVLAVLIYHIHAQSLPGGLAGVDVFFVISGFVVTAATAYRPSAGRRDLVASFYARRIVRIAPALLVSLLATWLPALLFIPPRSFSWATVGSGLGAFFGVSNIALAVAPTDYFAPEASMNPFLHTWTLGVEEQFYLVFPLILWLVRRPRGPAALPWPALVAVGLASVASFLLYAALSALAPKLAFFLMPARFWELGVGVGLCLSLPLWLEPLRKVGPAAAALMWGACFLALGWFLIRLPGPHFHIPPLLLPVGGTVGLIALACARPASLPARALAARLPVLIGLASYSLYLWHWPVLVVARRTFGTETWPGLLAALLVVAAATAFSYRFVERPVRTAFRGGALSRRRVLAAGPAALAAGGTVALLMLQAQPRLALATDFDRPWALPEGVCAGENGPFAGGSVRGWRPCDGGGRSTLFVIGDSHAEVYALMFALYAARSGRQVLLLFSHGCEFPPLIISAYARRSCAAFYDAAVARVVGAARPSDVIFFASLHLPPRSAPPLDPAERLANRDEAERLLRPLAATGARLVFEAPKPVFPAAPFRCADWFNRANPACRNGLQIPRSEVLARRAPMLAELSRHASAVPDAVVWDPLPILCPANPCSTRRNGKWLYRDENHVMPYANRLLLPSFAAAAGPGQ